MSCSAPEFVAGSDWACSDGELRADGVQITDAPPLTTKLWAEADRQIRLLAQASSHGMHATFWARGSAAPAVYEVLPLLGGGPGWFELRDLHDLLVSSRSIEGEPLRAAWERILSLAGIVLPVYHATQRDSWLTATYALRGLWGSVGRNTATGLPRAHTALEELVGVAPEGLAGEAARAAMFLLRSGSVPSVQFWNYALRLAGVEWRA